MIDAPQLKPIVSCQKRRIASLMSMRGWTMLARMNMWSVRCAVLPEELLALDRVVAAVAPWVAAHDTPTRENRAADHAVRADGLDRVGRARRMVLAAGGQSGGQEAPGRAHRHQDERAQRLHAASLRASPAFSSSSRN